MEVAKRRRRKLVSAYEAAPVECECGKCPSQWIVMRRDGQWMSCVAPIEAAAMAVELLNRGRLSPEELDALWQGDEETGVEH